MVTEVHMFWNLFIQFPVRINQNTDVKEKAIQKKAIVIFNEQ